MIQISRSPETLRGLEELLRDMTGDAGYLDGKGFMQLEMALLVVEIAKRAPDEAKYFPRGKWGTIQAIEAVIDEGLDEMLGDTPLNTRGIK